LGTLDINATSTGTITLSQGANALTTTEDIVVDTGYWHSLGFLYMSELTGSNASYTLSGTQSITVSQFMVRHRVAATRCVVG